MTKITLSDVKIVNDRRDLYKLIKNMQAERVCEIGVKDGANVHNLLMPCVKKFVAIDIWTETGKRSENDDCCSGTQLNSQYNNMLNWAKKDNRIQVVKDFSLNACNLFSDNYFDFVYIDADHTEEAVWKDLNAWWKKVRSGGVLAGHDYCDVTLGCGVKFGVIPAVDKFVSKNNLQLHVDNEEPWHDWFIPKP